LIVPLILLAKEPEKELEQIKKKIIETKKEQKKLREKETKLLAELRRIDKTIERAQKRVKKLKREEQKLKKELETLDKRDFSLQDKLQQYKNLLSDKLLLLYKSKLNGEEEMRIKLLEIMMEYDYRKITRLKMRRDSLRTVIKVSSEKLRKLKETRRKLEREYALIKKQRKRKSYLLKKIRSQRSQKEKLLKELLSERSKLEKLIKEKMQRKYRRVRHFAIIWPVKGEVIRKFGKIYDKRYGTVLVNKGIDIAADYGAPVRACADGVIVHTGIFLGYGKIILIDHQNGFFSLYAHLADIYVKYGDRVKKGDVIGEVGDTGAADRPCLHFELRDRGKAVDPLLYLR